MHPAKCKNQREKGYCKEKDCKLFHVKLIKQVQNPPDAPPAAKDSNGNEKTPLKPPPPPADLNTEVMKTLNSSTFFRQSGGPVSAPTGHQKNRAGNERKKGSFGVPTE